jgi:[glutamine synthetase] adenylyltransferase / [glutamine synthetase]-adenylyl-L-tyrosine phosphorylase
MVAQLVDSGPDPSGAWDRLLPIIQAGPQAFSQPVAVRRACALAGVSRALSAALRQEPTLLEGVDAEASVTLRLRGALVEIAGDDLSGEIDVVEATRRFSEAVDAIVASALDASRQAVSEKHPLALELPFAVVAMGKWGALELNYSSDIDLIFIHDNLDGQEMPSRTAALAIAGRLISNLSAPTFDGPALRVDVGLRPEGAMGPLTRSIDSYAAYYQRWAEPWELQALIKARPAAGTAALGDRFMALTQEVIWDFGLDPSSLRSIRRIKQEAEASASPKDIKRYRGGIRDIEFSVQLLQLVHGRHDRSIRQPATFEALGALATGGYIEQADHELLSTGYRFLRDLEHRIQLWDLRQTHDIPTAQTDRDRIGRSLGLVPNAAEMLVRRISEVRAPVREAHERLYFRPILDALVGSPSARLGVDQANLRLEGLGFGDIRGATQALTDLTTGLSRRSGVMRQVLPLMLDWLSLSPDPDLGLGQLRAVLTHVPDHSTLITLLQTNPLAGERLCRLLGTGRLLGDLIDRLPEFIPRLADDRLIGAIRDAEAETERLIGLLDSRPAPDAKVGTIRRFARRRKLRIAARDVLGDVPIQTTMAALADSADASIRGALHIATTGVPDGFAVIAMGKWGGRELSYESDLDLIYVLANDVEPERGRIMAADLSRILSEPSRHGDAYHLDANLRPEGKGGPLARSLESYRRYYSEWGEPWEMLAMIRARPVAGDPEVQARFAEVVDPFVWQREPPGSIIRAIQAIKARVEKERIPPREDPDYHLKLGKGSLSDIEFLTQLLQLRHGGRHEDLRVSGTIEAMARLRSHEILVTREHRALEESYLFCTRARLRLHLQAGREVNSMPTDPTELAKLATSLGYDRSSELREQYRRVTRRARQVFERRFFE